MKRVRHKQNYSSFYLGGIGDVPVVATLDRFNQNANLPSTLLYTVPAGQAGTYRLSYYDVVTQAATTSSTLPSASLAAGWTDADSGVIVNASTAFGNTATSNLVGATNSFRSAGAIGASSNTIVIQLAAGSSVNVSANGYASSGATAMLYAIHFKLEYLGA